MRPVRPAIVHVLRSTPVVMFVLLLSCAGGDGSRNAAESGETAITAEQAGAAVADAMLVTSQALYMAIASGVAERSVATNDGRLKLVWSEEADFVTGAGLYEITLAAYTIPEDDPFAPHYHGYEFTGSIRLLSNTGERTQLIFDLQCAHEDPERHPVRSIELDLAGFADDVERRTEGAVLVNGREFTFGELADAF